jgi:hypothetical protein
MTLNPVISTLGRRLRLAVIGGGPGSFIGAMHRQAARLDDRYELVAGVLSSNPTAPRQPAWRSGWLPGAPIPMCWKCWIPKRPGPTARMWSPS